MDGIDEIDRLAVGYIEVKTTSEVKRSDLWNMRYDAFREYPLSVIL